MEVETTVSLVFGGRCFRRVYDSLRHRAHVEEDLDLYVYNEGGGDDACGDETYPCRYTYRELKRSSSQRSRGADTKSTVTTTIRDRKRVLRCTESQVPYTDAATGRVLFVTVTHKSSVEESLTEEEWSRTVREDHTAGSRCRRTANKHRLAFPPESFVDLFGGVAPDFTRLTLGEYSTYGGTLEARTKCNPVYYLEVESENVSRRGDETDMLRLVETLFTVLPYRLIADTARRDASAAVRRERVDCVFDEFRRRFVNYHRCRDALWHESSDRAGDGGHCVGREAAGGRRRPRSSIRMFIMPKWDGVRATANYCDGFLFVRDACGSLSTYRADLPFDNDLILQLELVDTECAEDDGGDGGGRVRRRRRLIVITEILAVVVKNHNTLYHVYNRNNTVHDTGRHAGNVSTSITLRTQFDDSNHVCNVYRPVAPVFSLLVVNRLSAARWSHVASSSGSAKDNNTATTTTDTDTDGSGTETATAATAVNTYMLSDTPELLLTTVVATGASGQVRDVLRLLDRFHHYRSGSAGGARSTRPRSGRRESVDRSRCIRRLSSYLPAPLLDDPRFRAHCEGLLVAFVVCGRGGGGGRGRETPPPPPRRLPDYGYMKIKYVDTVDLEYRVGLGLATTARGLHRFKIRGVPAVFPGWAERSCPVTDDRAIVECYFDRDERCLVFHKDRPDKSKADTEEKIYATDDMIIETCALRGEGGGDGEDDDRR